MGPKHHLKHVDSAAVVASFFSVTSNGTRASDALREWLPKDLSVAQQVSLAAWVLIGLQLSLRAWASLGSWFYSDDFIFLTDASTHDLTWRFLFTPHDSHLMPLGVFITWVVAQAGAFNWTIAAIITIFLQAVASASCYLMLRKLFGNTWLILFPLGFYLFSTMALDAFIWWAAALNALPLHIAFFLFVAWEVEFLRDRARSYAAAACAAFALALLADPRGMIVATTAILLPLLFFTDGALWRRPWRALKAWWRLWLPLSALGAGYLVLYSQLSASPVRSDAEVNIAGLAKTMLGTSYLTSLVGGPWHWDNSNPPMGSVDPPQALIISAAVVVALLVITRALASPRTSLASFAILAVPLTVTLLGTAFGRATQIGTYAGLLMRFLADSLPVTALVIALSFVPLRGAVLQPRIRRKRWFNPQRTRSLVAVGCLVFLVGSLTSTIRYALLWHDQYPARAFVANYLTSVTRDPAAIADVPVPDLVQSPLSFPNNLPSKLLLPLGDRLMTSRAGNDLRILDDDGFHRQPAIRAKSTAPKGPAANCGYRVSDRGTTIRMDNLGNTFFWWASVSYLASADGQLDVRADGHKVASMQLLSGIHTYYFQGEGALSRLEFTNETPDVAVCVDHIAIGDLVPVG